MSEKQHELPLRMKMNENVHYIKNIFSAFSHYQTTGGVVVPGEVGILLIYALNFFF